MSVAFAAETEELLRLSNDLQGSLGSISGCPQQQQQRLLLLNLILLELKDRRRSDSLLNAIEQLSAPQGERSPGRIPLGDHGSPSSVHTPQSPRRPSSSSCSRMASPRDIAAAAAASPPRGLLGGPPEGLTNKGNANTGPSYAIQVSCAATTK